MISEAPYLRVHNLTKRFGKTLALENVSFTLERPQRVAIAGGNGAGKSTLFKMISGTIAPDSGSVHVLGRHLLPGSARDADKNGVAMVFQDCALCPEASVLENLFLGAELLSTTGFLRYDAMRQKARSLLEHFKLTINSLDAKVRNLSGGQQKSVAIGRALLREPRLLLLDEPTAGLDVKEQATVLQSIAELSVRGVGVLVCTHSPSEISQIAQRVIILRRGKLIEDRQIESLTTYDLAGLIST